MERWGGKDLKITGHGVNFRFLPRSFAHAYSENGGQINALLRIEEHHSCVGKGVRFRVRNTWFLSQTFDVTSVNQDRR